MASIIVSFFFLAALALVVFYLLMPVLNMNSDKMVENTSDSLSGDSAESNEVKTDKDESPERESEIFETALVYDGNFEFGETGANIYKIDEADISTESNGKIRNESQEIVKQDVEKLHLEEMQSVSDNKSFIIRLINTAMDSKINHNFQNAITAYERALALEPDDELRYLIVLDLCSLYKIVGNLESIYKLLGSVKCNMLSEDKKEDILRNIKNY